MKIKNLLPVLLLLCSLTNYSQITKRNWMLGGNASIDYGDITQVRENGIDYNYLRLNIKPNIGYFVIDKLALGTSVDFFYSKNYIRNNRDLYLINTKIGPFIRYYFLDVDRNVNIFLDTSYLFEIHQDSDIYNRTFVSEFGTAFFLTNAVSLEVLLRYAHWETGIKDTTYNDITDQISVGFGFQIHLERKR